MMEKRAVANSKLHRPIIKTVAAASLAWLAVVPLQPEFSIWPASRPLILWFALGAAHTHLFEYAYHRWLMHGRIRAMGFITRNHLTHHRVFHGEHFDTRDPRALEHVSGQWFLFPMAFLAHFLLLRPLLGAGELSSFLSGVVSHYLLFELTHWFAHVADNDFDRVIRGLPLLGWMREMQLRHHRLHHETPELDFNFVPPFAIDRLGATFLVPGDCTASSEGPCFLPGTMRLRTPFDRSRKSDSADPADERILR